MSGRFKFVETQFSGLHIVQSTPIVDERGNFSRLYCAEEYSQVGFSESIAQVNHSFTHDKGTVRGMHFQLPPHADKKIVTCIKGAIFDVAIDVRKDSPTFLQWHAIELSEKTQEGILIPEGFAHGFQSLTDDCELLYIHSSAYEPNAEDALNAFDSRLAIEWPVEVTGISERDRSHPILSPEYQGLVVS